MYTYTNYQLADIRYYLFCFYCGLYLTIYYGMRQMYMPMILYELNLSQVGTSIIAIGDIICYNIFMTVLALNTLYCVNKK